MSLVLAMRDHGVPPLMLPVTDGADGVREKYDDCRARLAEALGSATPEQLVDLKGGLPWHLKDIEVCDALLQDATWDLYFQFSPSEMESRPIGDRVFRRYPDIAGRLDEEGLIDLSGLAAQPTGILHRESVLHYHPLLRRHFTSRINDVLIQTLLTVAGRGDNRLRIAIDSEHLAPASAFHSSFEKDYWYGPQISPAALDDPRSTGTTVHADPRTGPSNEYPRLFVDWRVDKEGRKVVQIEELSDHYSATRGGFRLLRYLHAIRDVQSGVFVHCDGAVRAYDPAAYASRAAKQFVTGRESATGYRKLFRLDGEIATDEWSHVVAKWFRHNKLALEYLGSLADSSAGEGVR